MHDIALKQLSFEQRATQPDPKPQNMSQHDCYLQPQQFAVHREKEKHQYRDICIFYTKKSIHLRHEIAQRNNCVFTSQNKIFCLILTHYLWFISQVVSN